MIYVYLISIFLAAGILIRIFRVRIVRFLIAFRAKLQIHSLRGAIKDADDDKKETGRKNMVVFNNASGKFETIQKKTLKLVADKYKNKNNGAMTEGRVRELKKKKKGVSGITHEKVKQVEKKSLYVTN